MRNAHPAGKSPVAASIPRKITLMYLVVGGLWILLSDTILEILTSGPKFVIHLAILKGWLYVAATGWMLYTLIARGIAQIERSRREADQLEIKYRELIESANSIILKLDPAGHVTYFNEFAQEFFGFRQDEILGKDVVGTIVPELEGTGRDLRAMIQDIGRDPERYARNENENMKKSGERVWIAWTNKPVRDEQGTILEVLCIGNDITERKQAEESLHRFSLLVSLTRDIILLVRREDGRILDANEAAVLAYGYPREKLLSLRIHDLRTPETLGLVPHQMAEADAHGVLVETVHRRRDGTTFPVEISSRGETIEGVRTLISVVRDISARKQAEQEIRERERKYRVLFEAGHDGIFLQDPSGCFVDCNENGARLLGLAKTDILGRSPGDFSPERQPDGQRSIDLAEEQVRAAFSGQPQHFEYQILRADGTPLDVEISLNRLEMGDSFLLQAIVRDITDRKRAEAARRLNESRLEALLQLNRMTGATLHDITEFAMEEAVRLTQSTIGYVAFMNEEETVLTMYAWSRAAMLECQIEDKPLEYPVEMTGLWGEAVRQRRPVITNDYTAPSPFKRGTPEGHVAVFRHMNVPIQDGNRIVIVAGVGNKPTDYDESDVHQLTLLMTGMWHIVQRKRDEEALRTSEEKYRQLVENAHDAIFVAQDGLIKFPNPRLADLSGYSLEELTQRPFLEFVHPEDRELVATMHLKRMQGEEVPHTYSFRALSKSGNLVWAELSAVFLEWEGRPASLNFLRDITLQKKLESQLVHAQKMEAVGTLAGGIAHDFNNILQAVQGYTELLLLTTGEGDSGYRELQEISRAAKRGGELTRQLLTFSRKVESKLQPVDLNRIVEAVRQLLRRTIPRMIRVELELTGNLYPVDADASQIEQILMNLAVNARDAMPDGGILRIQTKNALLELDELQNHPELSPGAYVVLSVADTGQGMDPATLANIFDPFFTTKEVGKGTGLGLAMVYGIVRSHHGHITCVSRPGKGTRFDIYFPALDLTASAPMDKTD